MQYYLWLPSWYPARTDFYNGDFIHRHALATSMYNKIVVLYVTKDVSLVNRKHECEITEQENLIIYRVYYGSSGRKGSLEQIYSLTKYFRLQKKYYAIIEKKYGRPSLVHVQVAMKAGLLALELKSRYGIPYLVTEHWSGYNPATSPNVFETNLLFRRLTKNIIKKAAAFLPVSDQLGQMVNQYFVSKKFQVVPNVADEKLFSFKDKPRNGPFVFNHTSFMVDIKNPQGILAACEILRQKNIPFIMRMVGEASQSLHKLSTEKGLDDSVQFTGAVPYARVAELMQESDGFVLFSKYETLSCVVQEALCCGLPVISSKVGGVPEMVNQNNGYLVESEHVAALANAMMQMIERYNDFDRRQISAQAIQQFSYASVGRQIDEVYQALIRLR